MNRYEILSNGSHNIPYRAHMYKARTQVWYSHVTLYSTLALSGLPCDESQMSRELSNLPQRSRVPTYLTVLVLSYLSKTTVNSHRYKPTSTFISTNDHPLPLVHTSLQFVQSCLGPPSGSGAKHPTRRSSLSTNIPKVSLAVKSPPDSTEQAE